MLSRLLGIPPGLAMPSSSFARWVVQLVPHDQHTSRCCAYIVAFLSSFSLTLYVVLFRWGR